MVSSYGRARISIPTGTPSSVKPAGTAIEGMSDCEAIRVLVGNVKTGSNPAGGTTCYGDGELRLWV